MPDVTPMALTTKSTRLHDPPIEWELHYEEPVIDPFDVIADAIFEHPSTGEQKRSPMFYSGDGTWSFRFTGTALGRWDLTTVGPGQLGGHSGTVHVHPAKTERNGFLTTNGAHWRWTGTDARYVPQLVMSKRLDAYWDEGQVQTDTIDAEIAEFLAETGFTGFVKSAIAAQWFDLTAGKRDTRPIGTDATPDPRAFVVLEAFLRRAYLAGGATHLWIWGSDAHRVGWDHYSGPDGVGGAFGQPARRLTRYIAGRLGPIPGWSAGFGFDLAEWTDPATLQAWYDTQKRALGGWPHPLGARADNRDRTEEETVTRTPMTERPDAVFWTGGDYVGMYDYRVPYQWYRETVAFAEARDIAVLQEDRFRIREVDRYHFKDYTPALTRRGLWHAMMAGGVGNIWGNLLPAPHHGGSAPYDNKAVGEIQGVEFTVNEKDAIAAWHQFWFGEHRFRSDYSPANHLTNDQPGEAVWDGCPGGDPIAVAVAAPDNCHFVFYREATRSIRMNLQQMPAVQPAIALDTRSGEQTTLGELEANRYDAFDLGHRSDWAIAVGHVEA